MKTANAQCMLYLCKIAPREDTDVTNLNRCIERLSEFWQKHDVHCINTPTVISREATVNQYSDSYPKMGYVYHAQLDTINRNISIVEDYDFCIFSGSKSCLYSGRLSGFFRTGTVPAEVKLQSGKPK